MVIPEGRVSNGQPLFAGEYPADLRISLVGLVGSIPREIGMEQNFVSQSACSGLSLSLAHNPNRCSGGLLLDALWAISDPIPTERVLLIELRDLDLSGNQLLPGSVPSEIGLLTNLGKW